MTDIWWNTESGKRLRIAIHDYFGNDFKKALATFYYELDINPAVIERWQKGGNPSKKFLRIINNFFTKNHKINFNIHDEPIQLEAYITNYHSDDKRYVVTTYYKGKYVHSDRTGIYSYARKLVQTVNYRNAVGKFLQTNNFKINFNKEKSINACT